MTERSFKDAYGVLQQHAETLREQSEPNIDDLLTIVTESVAAYQVCKERIDAVEAALKAALDGVGAGASVQATSSGTDKPAPKTPRAVRKAALPAEPEVSDDDIPF